MKFLLSLFAFTACGFLAAPVFAAEQAPEPSGCAAKRQDITTQLENAKAAGNTNRQAGLEKALSEVNANCTDADLLKQQEQKVLDAKREVSRRQADLNKAMSKGDPEKIDKRKDKLAESRKELQEEQEKLENVKPDEDDD
ncbi:DUF1090 domain-containing protein [Pseudomonas sp. 15A4]|jgi:hypothetical protein|uniref:DUF1090 domain-containing protein n=1 Tax=Pseudomonas sp. 15A4 TaxID=2804761 RepID=UPI00196816FD|nr:DUF1090 domain-containing protein [Pseudomonas sp. 15A4]QSB20531.1 DUF1090 domain-containing protein [Pseudomonas sp. 15A4]